jgi:outer membrane protein
MTRSRPSSLAAAALAFFALAGSTEPALAQDTPPRAMTLDEAIRFAKTHQPDALAARARLAAERAAAAIPRAQWLPTAGVTAQAFAMTANNTTGTYVSAGPFMDIPRIGGTRVTSTGTFLPRASTLVGVGATQELFDFGRIGAQTDAAEARVAAEEQRAASVDLDVTFSVEEAYFAVLAAKAIVRASQDAYDRARAHRDLARAGVASGMRSPIEETRAEADLARFDIGRVKADGALATTRAALAVAVGVPEAALDATSTSGPSPDVPALETAVREAEARNPRVLETLAQLRAEEQRTRAIGAELRPDLSATATLTARAGGAEPSGNGSPAALAGFVPYVPNWDVGVVFSWPLFDPNVNARKTASRAREDARRSELAAVRTHAAAAIREAYVAVEVARAVLPNLERAVAAAQANYAQADARFKAGIGTSVELADAESLRTEAEIQLALGQFQLARARAAFGRAIAESR